MYILYIYIYIILLNIYVFYDTIHDKKKKKTIHDTSFNNFGYIFVVFASSIN